MADRYKPVAAVAWNAHRNTNRKDSIVVAIDSLRINQLGDEAWASYRKYLEALDRYDIDEFATFLADDVRVQFNNDDPMTGKDTAVQGMGGFWTSIQDMGYSLLHEPLNIYGDDQHYVLEALNHYDKEGSERITIHAVAFTDRDDEGQVTSIRVYQDLGPIYGGAS